MTEVPAERWEPYRKRDPRNAAVLRATTRWGSFLDDLPGFDAEFFGVSPREAELMDPQQRLAVEVSWEALEHAGLPPRALAGSDTAVLMGVNSDDYGKLIMEDLPGIEAWTGIGTSLCGVANRVSHLLDLRGPSVALDAACAASLVAVHQSCQLLRAGETSLALAGGVSALIGPGLTRVLDEAGATAPDGKCKTFDAAADGYGRGEGAAVVVLKRLADAHVTATGCSPWFAAARSPKTAGRSASCRPTARPRRTCSAAPATRPGCCRPVSVSSRRTEPARPPAIPSNCAPWPPSTAPLVLSANRAPSGRSNRTSATSKGGAGVVGLIKAALALHHEVIPPTTGVRTLTPAVDWADSGLWVPTEVHQWPRAQARVRGVRRCAATATAGPSPTCCSKKRLGGSPVREREPIAPPAAAPMSFRCRPGRRRGSPVRPICWPRICAASSTRSTMWRRRCGRGDPTNRSGRPWWPKTPRSCCAGSETLAADRRDATVVTGTVLPGAAGGAVWVFSGHGSHWAGMGSRTSCHRACLRGRHRRHRPVFVAELGFSVRAALTAGETRRHRPGAGTDVRDAGRTRRGAALTRGAAGGRDRSLGRRGRGLRGGRGARPRSRCRDRLLPGSWIPIGAGSTVPWRWCACHSAQPSSGSQDRADVVAAISSSPESTVISGTVDAVDEVCGLWSEQGVMVRRVATDVAFHSPAMDALTADLARLTGGLPPSSLAAVPLYTTALADPRSAAARDPDYWVANLRGRVRFAEAVTAAAEDGHRLFLEVSAHPVVSHSVVETLLHLGFDEHAAVPVLRREQPERRAIATAIASLHCHGAPVAHGVAANTAWAHDLPGTAWQHRRFWRTPTRHPVVRACTMSRATPCSVGAPIVTGPVPLGCGRPGWTSSTRPYPGDHPVQGTEIVPAAVLLNTFLAAAQTGLSDVRLRTPVAPGRARDIQVVRQGDALSLSSRLLDHPAAVEGYDSTAWLTHCSAVVAPVMMTSTMRSTWTIFVGAAPSRCRRLTSSTPWPHSGLRRWDSVGRYWICAAATASCCCGSPPSPTGQLPRPGPGYSTRRRRPLRRCSMARPGCACPPASTGSGCVAQRLPSHCCTSGAAGTPRSPMSHWPIRRARCSRRSQVWPSRNSRTRLDMGPSRCCTT